LSKILAEKPDVQDTANAKPLRLPTSASATTTTAVADATRQLENIADSNSDREDTLGVSVEFRNVYFHYPEQKPSSGLQDVSWLAQPGTTTAIIGHTGSGKTTVGRLLFRFYDAHRGAVLLHGQEVATLTQQSVRAAIGIVPQDTVLFNESIRYNVSYGTDMKEDTPFEMVRAAAAGAKILEFIENLSEGWDTKVGERGLKLSGGEKQRVAIARCLLKNPPVVLLDEATSALDTRTERSVQEALLALGKARTTVVIAHRLSTIKHAEQIVVLEKGRVVEIGTHERLMQAKTDETEAVDWSDENPQSQPAVADATGGHGPGIPRAGVYRAMWEAQLRGLDVTSTPVVEENEEENTVATAQEAKTQPHHGHGHGHGHHGHA